MPFAKNFNVEEIIRKEAIEEVEWTEVELRLYEWCNRGSGMD